MAHFGWAAACMLGVTIVTAACGDNLASDRDAGFACGIGYHACESACADDHDIETCGTSCESCPLPPANATATCDGVGCGFACEVGFAWLHDECSPIAPRPIAPLSTAMVTSRRPTLRWLLPAGTDGARVELCFDRTCTTMIETIDVAGSMTVPSVDLPAGTVFWRLRGRVGANVGNEPSPTWQVVVRARSTPLDLSWGSVLDVNGDGFADVAVGAPTALDDYGRVHVYLGAASGLATTPATSLTGPDGQGFFGWSVASASDVNGDGFADLIVGAPYYLGVPWAGTNAGRAYVYLGSETGLGTLATTVVAPDGDGSLFGSSVAFAGDINSDGYADVAVGATGTANGTGTVYVYFGGAGGISTSPAITIPGTDGPGAGFGYAVTNAGDLDGDGHGDLAVGAPSILQGAGHVHIYFGTVTGLATTPVTLAGPAGAGDHFAMSIAADDFDGDGYADLVVGEPAANGDWGQVCVYPGGTMGISASPAITYVGSYASQSGSAVDSAGDLDADGFADLIVGLPAMSPPPFDYTVGAADIYLGGSSGLASIRSAEVTVGLGIDYSEFGASVAGAGDVDGDGHGDVIVGAPVFNCCPTNSGAVFVYSGTDTGLDTNASAAWGGPDGANGAFGQSLN